MSELDNDMRETLITLTSDIVSAHVSNNSVGVDDLGGLISNVFSALSALQNPPQVEEPAPEPAVSIRSSVKPDHIVCLEDGKKLKMLKRYLATRYNMTPDQYRQRWGLPADYPMVAPAYAEKRRDLAKQIGLGRKPSSGGSSSNGGGDAEGGSASGGEGKASGGRKAAGAKASGGRAKSGGDGAKAAGGAAKGTGAKSRGGGAASGGTGRGRKPKQAAEGENS